MQGATKHNPTRYGKGMKSVILPYGKGQLQVKEVIDILYFQKAYNPHIRDIN